MSTHQQASYLTAANLKKSYGKNKPPVVSDISLTIGSGEIVGLLGPNGAGKTTTFYMLVGLIPTETGSIHIDQSDITQQSITQRAKAGLGYLPQESSIFRKMSIRNNILAVLELQPQLAKHERQHRCDQLLAEFKLERVADSMGFTVSGGERRRAEIARTMATKPKFILLDEPFAGIDPIAIIDIKKIVHKLAAEGVGILITDHNVQDTLNLCEKAYIVNAGQVIAEGSPEMITQDSNVQSVYLGKGFQLNPNHRNEDKETT